MGMAMNNQQLHGSFSELSTSLIADACLRLSITLRPAPAGIQPILERSHIAGPQRLDGRAPEALRSARFGDVNVTAEDIVFADADGVLFAPADQTEEIMATAHGIWQKERRQAETCATSFNLKSIWPGDPPIRYIHSASICARSVERSKNSGNDTKTFFLATS